MKKTLLLFSLILVLSSCAVAQQPAKEENEVATAVENLRQAMLNRNKQDLERLSATELSYGHSSGLMEDRAAFVDALVSGKSTFTSMDQTDQTIKVVGNTALVRHNLTGNTVNSGTPGTANLGVLQVWQKQQGQWKLIARQAYKR